MQFRLVEQTDGIFVRKLCDDGDCIIGIEFVNEFHCVAGTHVRNAACDGSSREVGNIEYFREEVVVGHGLAFLSIRRQRQTVQADRKRSDHELP